MAATTDDNAAITSRGYTRFCLGVFCVLLSMTLWVAAGQGFPGGSMWRSWVGTEGVTGGLTTAVRFVLHGDLDAARATHPSALYVTSYLALQLTWRLGVVIRPPKKAEPLWIFDLIASILLFAIAIHLPYQLIGRS